MQELDLKSLIPAFGWLIILIANTMGHPIGQMDAIQLATDAAALMGTVNGIVKDHKKPVQGDPPVAPQPPQQPPIGG